MSFLKRWKASKTNLVGPDFNKADWLEINLSETKVKFKNPPLTAMIPYKAPITNIDIYSKHALNEPTHKEELSKSKALCNNGWNFYSGLYNDSAIGGIVFDLVLIQKTSFENEDESIFNDITFLQWVLQQEQSILSLFNDEKKKRIEEDGLDVSRINYFEYPKSKGEVISKEYNGRKWLTYTISQAGDYQTFVYRTAIEDNYLLSLTFRPDCYHDDIESPAHNLQQVIPEAIESLMQSMHITLSPESQKQYDKANPKLLEANT